MSEASESGWDGSSGEWWCAVLCWATTVLLAYLFGARFGHQGGLCLGRLCVTGWPNGGHRCQCTGAVFSVGRLEPESPVLDLGPPRPESFRRDHTPASRLGVLSPDYESASSPEPRASRLSRTPSPPGEEAEESVATLRRRRVQEWRRTAAALKLLSGHES